MFDIIGINRQFFLDKRNFNPTFFFFFYLNAVSTLGHLLYRCDFRSLDGGRTCTRRSRCPVHRGTYPLKLQRIRTSFHLFLTIRCDAMRYSSSFLRFFVEATRAAYSRMRKRSYNLTHTHTQLSSHMISIANSRRTHATPSGHDDRIGGNTCSSLSILSRLGKFVIILNNETEKRVIEKKM